MGIRDSSKNVTCSMDSWEEYFEVEVSCEIVLYFVEEIVLDDFEFYFFFPMVSPRLFNYRNFMYRVSI